MEQNLKYFFEKLDGMETGTKFMMLLTTIIIPILDLILYKTHILNIPMTIRCAYVLVLLPCFVFSFALWIDDILKSRRYKKEEQEYLKEKQIEVYKNNLKILKELDIVLKRMTPEQLLFIKRFVYTNSEIIDILPLDVPLIPFIIANGFNINIINLPTKNQAQITENALICLKAYFDCQ